MNHLTLGRRACLAWLLAAGCWPAAHGQVIETTSAPTPVDPVDDNQAVLAQLADGLVFSLRVEGRRVELLGAEPRRVPQHQRWLNEGDTVRVVAMAGGREVGWARVPDAAIDVEEGRGLARRAARELHHHMIVSALPDVLQVWLPGGARPVHLDLRQPLAAACARASEACRLQRTAPPP